MLPPLFRSRFGSGTIIFRTRLAVQLEVAAAARLRRHLYGARGTTMTRRAIQIPSGRERRNDSSREPLLRSVVDASPWLAVSRANHSWEMVEDEEADCPNNARLFRIAVSNSLKNVAESVR